ncbi:MAG TPA: ATP-binding protein, partial [Chitinophagaceae bacterium]
MQNLTVNPSAIPFKISFLEGGGELGEMIRSYDWSKTSLGSPESWPQSLKTCVRIMLTSRQPIWIGWGKELIKLYNDPYKAIVGGKHPWALGQPASAVWKDIWQDIEPMLKTVMEKDEGTYVESQLLIMVRNGYPEETYYTFSYTPIPGDRGGTAGMICANTDDTERIIGERQLRTLKDLGKSLAEMQTVDDVYKNAAKILRENPKDFPFAVLYKIDNDGRNAAIIAHAGIDKEQTVFPSSIDLLNPKEGTLNFCRAFTSREIVLSENNGRRKNLPKGAWEIEASHFVHIPIITSRSNFPSAIMTTALNPYRIYDETYRQFTSLVADQIALEVSNVMAYQEERKRAEALAEVDKAKTLFFSNISHEFRTPLTLMLGPLEELLNSPKELGEEQKNKIETTHRNAIRLLRLVNNLLDFSRIEAGKARAQFQLTNISEYTKELASIFRSVIENANLEFIVNMDSINKPVYVDKNMWEKIVLNLLSNAFKYTLQGSVSISIAEKNGCVELKVKDTGIGIPEEELPKMFQRFHRVQNAPGRSFEGTGIGLSLVSELAKIHGGTVAVASRLGEGSEFAVVIPVGKNHLAADQVFEKDMEYKQGLANTFLEEAEALVKQAGGTSKKDFEGNQAGSYVLVVDDNADMRNYLKNLLGKLYQVETANNGIEALKKINKQAPSLVLSDTMMPLMDGIELVKIIKAETKWNHTPVILLSARAGEESKIEGYETGADDYLVKPFSARELMTRVKAQINLARKRKSTEDHLRNLFVQAPAIIHIFRGPEHIFEFFHPAALSLTGGKDLTGMKVREALPYHEETEHLKLLDEVYNTGKTIVKKEMRSLFNDKEKKLTEKYFDLVYQPYYDEEKRTHGVLAFASEVTENVLNRKRIEASERKFRMAIDQSPAAIAIIKVPEFTIELINKKWLDRMGATLEVLAGKSLFETFPMLGETGLDKMIREKIPTGEPHYENEYRVNFDRFGKTGIAYFNIAYQPLTDPNGIVNRLMIISHEITELVEARKKVEDSEQRKDDFIKMASHELKTPVTSIKGYVQLLLTAISEEREEKNLPPLLVRSSLISIDKQVTRLTRLMSELLDLSKIESGQLELNKELFSLNELVIDTVQDILYTNSKHNINVFHDFGCNISGDKDRLGQVLINLLTNAVKYSPNSDKIEVWVKQASVNEVTVSVKDYGIGIDKKDQDK